jgi:hypothetical protein
MNIMVQLLNFLELVIVLFEKKYLRVVCVLEMVS